MKYFGFVTRNIPHNVDIENYLRECSKVISLKDQGEVFNLTLKGTPYQCTVRYLKRRERRHFRTSGFLCFSPGFLQNCPQNTQDTKHSTQDKDMHKDMYSTNKINNTNSMSVVNKTTNVITRDSKSSSSESSSSASQGSKSTSNDEDVNNNVSSKYNGKWKKFESYFLVCGAALMIIILGSIFTFPMEKIASSTKDLEISEQELSRLLVLSRMDESKPETVQSLARLGYIYSIRGDKEKAAFYLRKASKCGDLSSMYNLALLLLEDVNPDYKKDGERILEAKNTSKKLQNKIGEATDLLRQASLNGHTKAQLEYGKLLLSTAKDVSLPLKDRKFAVADGKKWLEESAKRNIPEAHLILGNLYFIGIPDIVAVDPKEAAENFRIAAHGNIPEAMFHYGMSLKNGFGVQKNIEEGLEFLRKAAEKDFHLAIYEIGTIYLKGIPDKVVRDPTAAFQCFLNASKLGNRDATYMVAHCYIEGLGVEKDMKKAFNILELLSPTDPHAKVSLGVCYAQGNGVEKDYAKAVSIWKEILNESKSYQKHTIVQYASISEASFNLGVCYRYGLGVIEDITLAKEFFAQASAYGHEQAKIILEEIERSGS